MVKWIVYIVFLLVFTPCLLAAKSKKGRREQGVGAAVFAMVDANEMTMPTDTLKQLKSTARQDNTKVKEVAKARKQPKPEKVEDEPPKEKPKREKRPDGMQRPPEIPRRNDN